jgi:threonine dehydrogenase-like Zn-dependent dehydrogenase
MPSTMQAVVKAHAAPGPCEVLMRVLTACVCGTEIVTMVNSAQFSGNQ